MDFAQIELVQAEKSEVDAAECAVQELNDLLLAVVGGGIGNVALG